MISLLSRLGLALDRSASDQKSIYNPGTDPEEISEKQKYYADKYGWYIVEAEKKEKPTIPYGNSTSAVEQSTLELQLEAAKAYKIQAEKDMKELRGKYNQALKDLKDTDKKINLALQAQMKRETLSPLQEYSRMQRNTLRTVGLGAMNNKTSFALAGITILLGITAIIGRVE